MKKWLNKQMSAFVLGFLDTEMNYRSTTDEVVDAIKIVKEHIIKKFWTSQLHCSNYNKKVYKLMYANQKIDSNYYLNCGTKMKKGIEKI